MLLLYLLLFFYCSSKKYKRLPNCCTPSIPFLYYLSVINDSLLYSVVPCNIFPCSLGLRLGRLWCKLARCIFLVFLAAPIRYGYPIHQDVGVKWMYHCWCTCKIFQVQRMFSFAIDYLLAVVQKVSLIYSFWRSLGVFSWKVMWHTKKMCFKLR
jgi:hypothetical protein